MFERYTQEARRVIFWARSEAIESGSAVIETGHLLVGLLREDKSAVKRIELGGATVESIRKRIEEHRPEGTEVALPDNRPLSEESKRVLLYGMEEADRLSHKHIGTEHLLLGLLRMKKSLAARILSDCQLDLASLREELARGQGETTASNRSEEPPLED